MSIVKNINRRFFTSKEMNRGMWYQGMYLFETDKVIIYKNCMTLEKVHEYSFKKGMKILERYRRLVEARQEQREEEEWTENCEYRYGKKCY